MAEDIKFNQLSTADEIVEYIKNKENNHICYCHYSDIYGIDAILNSECIFASPIGMCNDKDEDSTEKKNIYCVCFSALYSENIPMWYLYSGISGSGARIELKKSVFNKWKKDLKVCVYDTKDKRKAREFDCSQCRVECGDIVYASVDEKDNGKYRLKYNNNVNNSLSESEYKALLGKMLNFRKNIPWFYEKEYRILIDVDEKLLSKINKDCSRFKIAIEFNEDIFEHIQITKGPEAKEFCLDKFEGLLKYAKSKIHKSSYDGKIEMKLFERALRNPEEAQRACEYIQKSVGCKLKEEM